MGGRLTYKCHSCKEIFLASSMNEEITSSGVTFHYCQKCYNEKVERMNFYQKICEIFGLKAPGPRIWTERRRLINTYGYTDKIIIDCLDYIYNVEKKRKLTESLCLVTPTTVNAMMRWKRNNENKGILLAAASQQKPKEINVDIKENNDNVKEDCNPDDWLEEM